MGIQCRYCSSGCIRKGIRGNVQLHQCKTCRKYQRSTYHNKACDPGVDKRITAYVKEGCGIRSISRIMGISPTTVIARIKRIASRIRRPHVLAFGRSYEVDELATFCRRKTDRVWVAYALERGNRTIADFVVGARTKRNLGKIIDTLLLAQPKSITTDRLDIYRSLVPTELHRVKAFGLNRIERYNLTLRTRLRRLCRRTICFTRSLSMLHACVVIQFWG